MPSTSLQSCFSGYMSQIPYYISLLLTSENENNFLKNLLNLQFGNIINSWSSGCRDPSIVHRYFEEIVYYELFLLYHIWSPIYSVSNPHYSTAVLTNLAITSNISNSMDSLQFLAFNSMKSLSHNSLPISSVTPSKPALQTSIPLPNS